jgi:hypothetical protein
VSGFLVSISRPLPLDPSTSLSAMSPSVVSSGSNDSRPNGSGLGSLPFGVAQDFQEPTGASEYLNYGVIAYPIERATYSTGVCSACPVECATYSTGVRD